MLRFALPAALAALLSLPARAQFVSTSNIVAIKVTGVSGMASLSLDELSTGATPGATVYSVPLPVADCAWPQAGAYFTQGYSNNTEQISLSRDGSRLVVFCWRGTTLGQVRGSAGSPHLPPLLPQGSASYHIRVGGGGGCARGLAVPPRHTGSA